MFKLPSRAHQTARPCLPGNSAQKLMVGAATAHVGGGGVEFGRIRRIAQISWINYCCANNRSRVIAVIIDIRKGGMSASVNRHEWMQTAWIKVQPVIGDFQKIARMVVCVTGKPNSDDPQ